MLLFVNKFLLILSLICQGRKMRSASAENTSSPLPLQIDDQIIWSTHFSEWGISRDQNWRVHHNFDKIYLARSSWRLSQNTDSPLKNLQIMEISRETRFLTESWKIKEFNLRLKRNRKRSHFFTKPNGNWENIGMNRRSLCLFNFRDGVVIRRRESLNRPINELIKNFKVKKERGK